MLTALGIVEVPEGMPLSEGATRARQARRLLQRVLEFAPDGMDLRTVVRIGRRAAEGIVEVATEEEADLIIFGWGGPRPRRDGRAPDEDGRRSVPPDDRRGRARRAVRHRGGQAARRPQRPPDPGAGARRPARRAGAALRGRAGPPLRRRGRRPPRHPPDVDPVVRAQAERALAAFVRLHARGRAQPLLVEGDDVAAAIMREAERAGLVVMGATALPRPWRPGAPPRAASSARCPKRSPSRHGRR